MVCTYCKILCKYRNLKGNCEVKKEEEFFDE